jgi:hypothetical protein
MYAYAFGWLKSSLECGVEEGRLPAEVMLLVEEALREAEAFRREISA